MVIGTENAPTSNVLPFKEVGKWVKRTSLREFSSRARSLSSL